MICCFYIKSRIRMVCSCLPLSLTHHPPPPRVCDQFNPIDSWGLWWIRGGGGGATSSPGFQSFLFHYFNPTHSCLPEIVYFRWAHVNQKWSHYVIRAALCPPEMPFLCDFVVSPTSDMNSLCPSPGFGQCPRAPVHPSPEDTVAVFGVRWGEDLPRQENRGSP